MWAVLSLTDRKGWSSDELSQGAAKKSYTPLRILEGCRNLSSSLSKRGCMVMNTNISDEELENYLDFLNESEQDTVTVNRNFLLELAREVFFYHGLAEEQADLKKAYQGTSG